MEVFELQLYDNPGALAQLILQINDYINLTGIPRDKFAGIGIGMPGFINVNDGINYTHLDAGGQSLTQLLTTETGIPTYIDNDSSLIALAEQKFGIAKDQKDVMVINLGWGIGLGMIINDEIFRGHNGFAGEFSHIPIADSSILCSCGKRGCLETEASMLVVVHQGAGRHKTGPCIQPEIFGRRTP